MKCKYKSNACVTQRSENVRLRNCATGKLLRSVINKNRIKPFYDGRGDFESRCQWDRNRWLQPESRTEAESENPQESTSHADSQATQKDNEVQRPDSGTSNNDEWYEIEKILKHRRENGRITKYQVLWKDSQNTAWVRPADVTQEAIDTYWRIVAERGNRRRGYRRQ